MQIRIIKEPITRGELAKIAQEGFGDLVKGVVDIEKEILALGAELHSDEEALLLQNGSKQNNLWGINLYPSKYGEDFVEFDSVINLRPSEGNFSRAVDNPQIQRKILEIVKRLIKD